MNLRERLLRGHHGVVGVVLLVLFFSLAVARVEPIPTYFYAVAWYPMLLIVDACVARKRGGSLLIDRPLALLCLFLWSVPFWLLYELVNLRVENWYYVGAPRDPVAGRVFLVVAFATVIPGLFEVFDLVRAYGWFTGVRTRPFSTTREQRAGMFAVGWGMLILLVAFPTYCYPLVWGFLVLLLEPLNRRPGWGSLLRDLEKGRPARLLQLLFAGLLCGAYWEVMNMPARARWIYTVPFFDTALGVEMPPLGFLGFPPFALCAYSFVRALEVLGLSVPFESARGPVVRVAPAVRAIAIPAAVAAVCLVTIHLLEQRTVDAHAPRVRDLPSILLREAAVLEIDGLGEVDAFLRETQESDARVSLARRLIVPVERIDALVAEARLADLRGIGTENARLLRDVGVATVTHLAESDADRLFLEIRELGPRAGHVRPQRVRVWVRGARAVTES